MVSGKNKHPKILALLEQHGIKVRQLVHVTDTEAFAAFEAVLNTLSPEEKQTITHKAVADRAHQYHCALLPPEASQPSQANFRHMILGAPRGRAVIIELLKRHGI